MTVALGAKKMPRLLRREVDAEKTLMADLEHYQQAAVGLGATSAKIILARL